MIGVRMPRTGRSSASHSLTMAGASPPDDAPYPRRVTPTERHGVAIATATTSNLDPCELDPHDS